jgi:hypothetical protein
MVESMRLSPWIDAELYNRSPMTNT